MKFKAVLSVIVSLLLVTSMGCESFTRKFTRKSKKDKGTQEMVLSPEEYKGPQASKEEIYRQYFLFWKSWHDELIEALLQGKSPKKQIDCSQEAINNLVNLKALLHMDMQNRLDVYIGQLKELQDQIKKDPYGSYATMNTRKAERIKMRILRDFSYNKIKNYLL
ncbi:MAG: hypothetical protein WC723_05770 [Candidatus Omnitrophota bacterium]